MKRSATNALFLLLPLAALTACGGEPAGDQVPAGDTAATGAPTTLAPPSDGATVDPNEAGADELTTVGIDRAVADELIGGRPYENMLQVDEVLARSLDEQEREAVYARMWLPIDLNTASSEEILLIPGVGERMLHEFEEYRPYRSIEEFRREIGKYVDDEEVARLERYVEVR